MSAPDPKSIGQVEIGYMRSTRLDKSQRDAFLDDMAKQVRDQAAGMGLEVDAGRIVYGLEFPHRTAANVIVGSVKWVAGGEDA